MDPVIVFGPTGNIGAVVARTAAQAGAKVVLAMRDTNKTITGIDEQSGSFTRVHADLQKPETVEEAVRSTGAKRAFVYIAPRTPDHMKGTFAAMKAGGIDFVVFLSSFTVPTDVPLKDVPQSELIAYFHAQAEASLHEVYDAGHFVSLRPGSFATNHLRQKDNIRKGQVALHAPDFRQDNITFGDIGEVGGAILVSGPQDNQQYVYLHGPQVIPQREAVIQIGEVLGVEVKVTELNDEQALEQYLAQGTPKPFAEYMVRAASNPNSSLKFPHLDEGVQNVQRYAKHPATPLRAWVEANSGLFAA
ncbi:hypothetical protein BDY17DRAFT_157489 [Neohortaea acidophila]|uniref:NAD(P)-binding domain-containing protein n=1 Tax=Neohortaea acidophila TaxID=245834 RepID=A0A6A6PQA7_9PEZI|nr:uncharacterized protein BDY17DRAFT_157489 [Neohortaea acidophila]KAF2482288.1 hypothetical protein BDY17DRAFT_157489 [Neohortaea acidophila]